jgi:hypothetical protein
MTDILPVLGLAEIAEAYGLSKQRAGAITTQQSQGFPEPLASLASGRVWDRDAVYRWALNHGRPWTEPAAAGRPLPP